MIALRTPTGEVVRLGGVLGRGGEAMIYHVEGRADLAAKIYSDGRAQDRHDKVHAMVANSLHAKTELIAFPIQPLQREAGGFAGFTMRKVGRAKPIHQLYGPGSRKAEFPHADFRFLARVATNVARAVGRVHADGCVIGDINHSGILVSDQAIVTLIDADSFQYRSGGRVFRSIVGTGEYTAPELQGVALKDVDREPHHDAFGLAVLLFQLLFMGKHPFAGRYGGPGDMPIERAIREGRFAYSSRRAETTMDPPPFSPTLHDLPPEMAATFEAAFTADPSRYRMRPTPEWWVTVLSAFEAQLTPCRVNPAHHFAKNAAGCPWCRLEGGMGVSLFPEVGAASTPSQSQQCFDLTAAIKAIERVASPGGAPEPLSFVPKNLRPERSPAAHQARRTLIMRRVAAVLLVAGGVGALANGVPFLLGAVLFLGCFLFREGDTFAALKAALGRAQRDWEQACSAWSAEAGPAAYDRKQGDLAKLVTEYKGLDALEMSKLADLDRRRRELQLQRHLDAHLISKAKIAGIGDGRKATLASFGIETALDVTQRAVQGVPGFGDAMTARLLSWRASVEMRFVFNPNLGTDPVAIRQVKDGIARRRAELQQALVRGPLELEQIRAHVLGVRTRPTQQLIEAYRALKQAEADLE